MGRTATSLAVLAAIAVVAGAVAPLAAAEAAHGRRSSDPVQPARLSVPGRGVGLSRPASLPGPHDALSRAVARGTISPQRYALLRARSVFDLHAVRERFPGARRIPPELVTAVLRDLALRMPEMTAAQRHEARLILARPDDGSYDGAGAPKYRVRAQRNCTRHFCVHWVRRTTDAPQLTDANGNGLPDYIDQVEKTLGKVWRVEVSDYGFRRPESDKRSRDDGGNGKLDVYIADIGAEGYYGYCTTDDPRLISAKSTYPYLDGSAYCVLDNDYSPKQFGYATSPLDDLRVTAAHEFFHAVQGAYNWGQDLWLMEGTAAWIEDQVYDRIDDNYQYLKTSALTHPGVPVDSGDRGYEYGAWLFFRFLSEDLSSSGAPAPGIIRSIWYQASYSGPRSPGYYSLFAVAKALGDRGRSLHAEFVRFGVANLLVRGGSYEEGRAYASYLDRVLRGGYGDPPVTAAAPTGTQDVQLRHLATAYEVLVPPAGQAAGSTLQLAVDLPDPDTGARAAVVVIGSDGSASRPAVPVDAKGAGSVLVDFDPATVEKVVLILSNSSDRYLCNRGTTFTCAGTSRDDDRTYRFTPTVITTATATP